MSDSPGISLTKASPSVSLTKSGGAGGVMRINLNWNQRPARSGLFGRKGGGVDLDLACLWELADGSKGVVQALGDAFGDLDGPPYVRLDADDRTGAATGGENLHVNLAHAGDLRRLLVFAFIYEGVPSWDQAEGVVTLYPASGPQVQVRLDEHAGGSRMCAVALIENVHGDLVVQREVRYVPGGHVELDAMYAWGLQWTPGSK